jgi:hypothetical protein
LVVIPASPDVVSAPVASGRKLSPTTPHEPTMNIVNTGGEVAAHADRSGRPSRKGRPMATVPAPRRNARRLMAFFRTPSWDNRKPCSFPDSLSTMGRAISFGSRITRDLRGCGTRRF